MDALHSVTNGNRHVFTEMTLDQESLSRLFPFYFVFDEFQTIIDAGPSARKLMQNKGSGKLSEILRLARPASNMTSFMRSLEHGPKSVVFSFLDQPLTKLKGEVRSLSNGHFVFLGSVWVGRIENLGDLGLSFTDFSTNDPTVDYLHLMKSHEIVANELRDTLDHLRKQREDLELHSLIAEETRHMVVIGNSESEVVWVNKSFEETTGFLLKDIYGKNPFEFLFDNTLPADFVENARKARLQKQGYEDNIQVVTSVGDHIWVKFQGQPVFDEEGNFTRYFALLEDITEQKRSADEKRLLQDRLSMALDASGSGVWEYQMATGEAFCDDRFFKLFRLPFAARVSIRFFLNQVHPDDVHTYRELARRTAKGQFDSVSQQFTFMCGDGKYRRFLVRYQVFRNSEKTPVKLIGMVLDIDSVAQLEQALKVQTKRYAQLISNMNSGVLVEDESRRIVLTNQQFLDYFSISSVPDAMIGMDCSMSAEYSKHLFKDQEQFVQRIAQILERNEPVVHEELEMADGRILERNYFPLVIDNHYHGHLWQYNDITERKNSEKELRRNEEKYRKIIENMNLGLIEVDNDERIQFVNQSFCKMSGYEMSELIGQRTIDLFLRVERSEFIDARIAERKKGRSGSYELEVLDKNGHRRWWLISRAPLYDVKNVIEGSIGIHLDVTGQKLLENGLRNAKQLAEENARAKEVFLANMSHELRTPVNGIIGVCRLMKHTPLNEQQGHYVDLLESTTVHLSKVLGDVLDLSRINAKDTVLDRERFRLVEVLQDTIKMLMLGIQKSNVELITNFDELEDTLYDGDLVKIKQVLFNLIGNALKFTPQGRVSVSARSESGGEGKWDVFINIEDSGIGMSEEFLKVAFTKFTQEDNSLSRKFGGAGLGLNITRNLIEWMGGTISIKSQKGKGTQVTVFLPLDAVEDSKEQQEFTEEELNLEGVSVLLAEDNELNAMVLKLMLEAKGCEVQVCATGFEVLEQLGKREFQLVLMDLHMPGMDGYQTTLTIRNEMHLNVPIIALTADMRKGESLRCLSAGMNDFLLKPYEENVLYSKMKRLIKDYQENRPQTMQKVHIGMLERAAQGNPSFVSKMLNIFMNETALALQILHGAIKEGELHQVKEMAHRLRTSLNNLGLTSAAACALSLEESLQNGAELQQMMNEMLALEMHLQFARRDVQEEINRLNT